MPFAATWTDLEMITLRESEKGRDCMNHLHVESKKTVQVNLFTEQKKTYRHRK